MAHAARPIIVFCACLTLATGCRRAEPQPVAPEKPRVEADLSRTKISREAYKSLGIQVQKARIEEVQETRAYTAWIVPRPTGEDPIIAPVNGYVRPVKGDDFPLPGQKAQAKQPLFRLEPHVSPLEMVQFAMLKRGVEADLKKAQEQLVVAQKEAERMRDLVAMMLRSKQELEQAEATLRIRDEEVKAAKDKLNLFPTEKSDGVAFKPLDLSATQSGVILQVNVSPGQFVTAGSPLASVANLSDPWVRVQVPEYDFDKVDRAAPVEVILPRFALGKDKEKDEKKPPVLMALPSGIVSEVDRAKHAASLFYSLKGAKTPFLKEQLATAQVRLGTKRLESVAPYSAVVFDAYGGAWVYLERTGEKDTERVFERRRVEVGASLEDGVVLRPSLKADDRVVVEGAEVLFSREFFRPPIEKAEAVDDDD